MNCYTDNEVKKIVSGYEKLNKDGRLKDLLQTISRCTQCRELSKKEKRSDAPINQIVRSLKFKNDINKIKSDDALIRKKFSVKKVKTSEIDKAKFAVGLLPWCDRSMMFNRKNRVKLMIIGIDFKHMLPFIGNKRDHSFPLDSYTTKSNIWGPSWKNFWKNLLGKPYDDEKVNDFLTKVPTFITNSMLCFGGNDNPQKHHYPYLQNCRNHIHNLIDIVKPEVIVSFGQLGCRNVSEILQPFCSDDKTRELFDLLKSNKRFNDKVGYLVGKKLFRLGVKTLFKKREIYYWPLYQPARSHMFSYKNDYTVLRKLLK